MRRMMEFQGPEGLLDGLRVFNTFRVSQRWHDVEPGELVDVHVNGKFLAAMPVVQVEVGPLRQMLELHSGVNDGRDFASTDPQTIRGRLLTELDGAYGGVMLRERVAVIYLANLRAL